MIDNEVNLDYLLEPTFQLVNTAGKPLTGGWIEVYIHGTRDRYYCSSDFDGTLHPFKIPLDSLGSNIVLASPFNKYDVYVYNKFGSLQMSRYGVHTGGNFSDISGEEQYFIGEGQLTVDAELGTDSYILDNLTQIDGNLPASSGNLEIPDESLYNVEANFEFEILNYNLINQDVEIEVEIKNPCRITDHVNVLKGYTTINCSNVNKNTLTLCGLIYGGKDSITGNPHIEISFKRLDSSSTPAQIRAHLTNLSVYKISGMIAGESGGGETYYAGDYINISSSNVISAVGLQPAGDYATNSDLQAVSDNIPDVSDLVTQDQLQSDLQDVISQIPDVSEFVTESELNNVSGTIEGQIQSVSASIPDVSGLASTSYVDNSVSSSETDIKSWVNQQGYLSNSSLELDEDNNVTAINGYEVAGTTYTAGDFININNDVISVTGVAPASSIPETEDVSFEELDISQFALASAIPDVSDFVTNGELNSVSGILESQIQNVSAAIPDVSGLATETYVNDTLVSAKNYTDTQIGNLPTPVNADWTSNSGLSQILNKPTEKNIVAGSYISISEVNGNVQIAANGVQPSGNYLTSSDVTNVTYVNSLPGSPVAGTLYLIPET